MNGFRALRVALNFFQPPASPTEIEEFHDADRLRTKLDREGKGATQAGVQCGRTAAKRPLFGDVSNPQGLALYPDAPIQAADLCRRLLPPRRFQE